MATLLTGRVPAVPDVQGIDEAGRKGQTHRLRHINAFGLGVLHVQTLLKRHGFDVLDVLRCLWQVRQAIRQGEQGLPAPEAHQACELLTAGKGGLLGACELRCGICKYALFPGLVQPAPVAHACHSTRQLRPRFGSLLDIPHIRCCLLGRDRLDPGLARSGRELHHLFSSLPAGQSSLLAGVLCTPGQCEQPQHVQLQEAFDFDLVTFHEAPYGEVRNWKAARLHALRVAGPQACQ
jgi:hypothetical protein